MHAQNTTDSFALRINHIFQHVDKDQIPTGILTEYGIDFLNLDNYTGLALHDSNYVGNMEWFGLYNSIYSSQVRVVSALLSPDSIGTLFGQNNSSGDPIGLAIMHYNYNAYREDAVSAGLVTISNDQIYDVSNRQSSPYLNKTLFAISPCTNISTAGDDYFIFKPSLVFTNSAYSITSLEVDKGSGYYSVNMSTAFSFGFTSTGIYDVKFRITLSDNSQHVSHTKLFIKPSTGAQERYSIFPHPTLSQVINGSKAFQGVTGFCNVQVHLSTSNSTGQIRKPFIVVEGFDAWKVVDPNNPNQNYTSRDFLDNVNLVFGSSGSTFDFNDELDVTGEYDLIFVDFDNGTDYIQRNAFVVDAVIRWVNSVKTSWGGVRQQNVIMGQSMGGLCTRYALRDMENNNINHECRLFISHDVPHQGVNIPIGVQMAAHHLGSTRLSLGFPGISIINVIPNWMNPFAPIRNMQTLSETPAAKQMIIQRIEYDWYSNQSGMFTIIKTDHQNFQNEIDQFGWPINSRNIGVSNAICNTDLVFPDNSQLFNISGETNHATYFGQLWRSLVGTIIGYMTNLGTLWEFPLALVSTKASLKGDIWANSVAPSFQNTQIYNGDFYIKRKILWIINVNTYITKARGYSGTSAYPLDNSPAGVYDLNEFGFDQATLQAQLPAFLDFLDVSIYQPRFSFVPKMSGLNISSPYSNLRTNTCQASLVCEGGTKFDNYYSSPTTNELHISFNQGNATFIFNEMQGNPPALNLPASPTAYKIYETNDCNSVSVLATATNVVCYDWEVTGDLLINGSVTSLTCTSASVGVTSTTGAGGTIRVRVKISNCYSAFTNICFSPCIPWASPNFTWIYSAPMTNEPLQAQVDEFPGATSYQWFINGVLVETTSTGYLSTYNWPCTSEGEGLTVLAITDCGRTIAVVGGTYSPVCGRAAGNIKVYPNPASSTITISLNDIKNAKGLKQISQVKVLDKFGAVRKLVKVGSGQKTVSLDVSKLPPDIYYFEISDGMNKERIPAMIRR